MKPQIKTAKKVCVPRLTKTSGRLRAARMLILVFANQAEGEVEAP
jgi:hypothetical protein